MITRRFAPGVALLVTILGLVVAACGGPAPAPAVAPSTSGVTLATGYADALNVRNQLLLGTLRLEGSPNAVTADQATKLLPLWQAYKAMTAPGSTAATQEIDAVLAQIQQTLTPNQVGAIAALKLTTADLNRYYEQEGLPTPPSAAAAGQPASGTGGGGNLSDAARQATMTARGITGTPVGGSPGTALLNNVITLLTTRAGQ